MPAGGIDAAALLCRSWIEPTDHPITGEAEVGEGIYVEPIHDEHPSSPEPFDPNAEPSFPITLRMKPGYSLGQGEGSLPKKLCLEKQSRTDLCLLPSKAVSRITITFCRLALHHAMQCDLV